MVNPGQNMVMRGGMMIPDSFVTPQTSMIPSRKEEASKTEEKPVGVQPLSQRMNVAYDKFVNKVEPEKGVQGKDVVALGRLLLEIEQVKNNLQNIAQEVQTSSRKKKELDEKEVDLLEKEEDKLTALGASFRGFRRRLAGVSALLAGKQFLEGDISGGVQAATVAVGALLPEIVKITSGLVLGGLIRGGGRGVAAPRGGRGGLLPLLLAGGGLLGAGSFLGSRGGGDQRRFELTKRQALPQLLSRNDVRRFRLTTNRFDNLVSNVNNNKLNITNSAFTTGFQEDVELPPTAKDSAGNDFETIMGFIGGGEEESEGDDLEVSVDEDKLSSLPSDITSDDLAFLGDDSDGDVNIFDFDEGGNTEQPVKIPSKLASSSNVSVNPEFSDNSKITYILQYGGGAVV